MMEFLHLLPHLPFSLPLPPTDTSRSFLHTGEQCIAGGSKWDQGDDPTAHRHSHSMAGCYKVVGVFIMWCVDVYVPVFV